MDQPADGPLQDPLFRARNTAELGFEYLRQRSVDYPIGPGTNVSLGEFEAALAQLDAGDETTRAATFKRWVLQSAVQVGLVHNELGPELRKVNDDSGGEIGELAFNWTRDRLTSYQVDTQVLEYLGPDDAWRYASWRIWTRLRIIGIAICLPLNVELTACRGSHPSDSNFITTVRGGATYNRTIEQLARVYDPRMWAPNPLAPHITLSQRTSDRAGLIPNDPGGGVPGSSWSEFIKESVVDITGTHYLTQTLYIDYAATQSWARVAYRLGENALPSSGTANLERDWGFIHVEPDPLPLPGNWSRVTFEKNIRFNNSIGSSNGGNVGWGRLANLLAPNLIAEWIGDMCYAACWDAPTTFP